MLQINDEAVEALRQIGDLHIRGIESDGEVELEIEEGKEPGVDDQLVERDGVKVYLDPVAASALDDQVLGIHGHDDHFHFSFDDQEQSA
jgi:Fe-S cluster assembly iron-binding protein IscA